MAQRPLWYVEVAETEPINRYLRKLVLRGESLKKFPQDSGGDYIKLLLPKSVDVSIDDVDLDSPDLSGFSKRSFTVQSAGEERIVLWVTEHAGDGPAARWIESARVGDRCLITGPGPVDRPRPDANNWLFCADLPGLAGVDANLARLPSQSSARVLIEIPSSDAKTRVRAPVGVEVEWLVTQPNRSHGDALVEMVEQIEMDRRTSSVWAACEYSVMKRLRTHFREAWHLPKERYYLSSYWKLGDSDEQHKKQKKQEFPEG